MFKSILSNELNSYLELRKLNVNPKTLSAEVTVFKSLDLYLAACNYANKDLSEEILTEWIKTLKGKSKTISGQISAVRSFVKYINSIGGNSFIPNIPKVKSEFIPYIFSDEELKLIFHYADNLNVKKRRPYGPYTALMIPMLLRILYGCGMRLGETLAMRRKDIDFKSHTFFLRSTKFSKERVIPVHETLMDILKRYCLALGIMFFPDAYLFPGLKPNCHFTKRQAEKWFAEILRLSGIDQREKELHERGACLHCLRHVFVLKAMQQMEALGCSVDMNDLLLPAYLGHNSMIDTDKYFRFSGAQLPETIEAFEAFTSGLFPEMEVPYEE